MQQLTLAFILLLVITALYFFNKQYYGSGPPQETVRPTSCPHCSSLKEGEQYLCRQRETDDDRQLCSCIICRCRGLHSFKNEVLPAMETVKAFITFVEDQVNKQFGKAKEVFHAAAERKKAFSRQIEFTDTARERFRFVRSGNANDFAASQKDRVCNGWRNRFHSECIRSKKKYNDIETKEADDGNDDSGIKLSCSKCMFKKKTCLGCCPKQKDGTLKLHDLLNPMNEDNEHLCAKHKKTHARLYRITDKVKNFSHECENDLKCRDSLTVLKKKTVCVKCLAQGKLCDNLCSDQTKNGYLKEYGIVNIASDFPHDGKVITCKKCSHIGKLCPDSCPVAKKMAASDVSKSASKTMENKIFCKHCLAGKALRIDSTNTKEDITNIDNETINRLNPEQDKIELNNKYGCANETKLKSVDVLASETMPSAQQIASEETNFKHDLENNTPQETEEMVNKSCNNHSLGQNHITSSVEKLRSNFKSSSDHDKINKLEEYYNSLVSEKVENLLNKCSCINKQCHGTCHLVNKPTINKPKTCYKHDSEFNNKTLDEKSGLTKIKICSRKEKPLLDTCVCLKKIKMADKKTYISKQTSGNTNIKLSEMKLDEKLGPNNQPGQYKIICKKCSRLGKICLDTCPVMKKLKNSLTDEHNQELNLTDATDKIWHNCCSQFSNVSSKKCLEDGQTQPYVCSGVNDALTGEEKSLHSNDVSDIEFIKAFENVCRELELINKNNAEISPEPSFRQVDK